MKSANTAWFGLVSTAAIVAMFLDFAAFTSSEEVADIDAGTTASISTKDDSLDVPTFVISGPGGSAKCRAFPAESGMPGHDALTVESDCAGLYPPLANAKTWHSNEDGTIDLADNSGRTIVEFSPGDGLAYISVEPRSVILSMSTEGVSAF
jgi:hypothetical protein